MAALAEILGDVSRLTAVMKSPVPANYLAGVARKKIRTELIQTRQKHMVELDDDLLKGMAAAVARKPGIDVKEHLRDLRASSKPEDLRLAEALRNRIVHPLPQLLPDLLQFRPHPFADRLSLDSKASRCPGPPTQVYESQKVERLRVRFSPTLPIALGKSPELDQSGLLRVQFQIHTPHPLLQFPA